MAGYISNEEYKKAFEEKFRSQNEWYDELRVKRFIHPEEIKTWREGIAKDLSDEQFNQMVNDIAKDREAEKMKQFMTVEELYKKLGEMIFAGHGKDFVNIKSEDMDYLADKSFVNDIKIGEDYTIEINV